MKRLHRLGVLAAGCLAMVACVGETHAPALERIGASPLLLAVEGEGQLTSARSTPLLVPGENWSQRQLAWMVPDGSAVRQGELIARFTSAQGEKDLAQVTLDLQRNALMRAAKEEELQSGQERVGVDLARVATDLAIAQRYAQADVSTLARNDVLDAVQDTRLLGTRRETLEWKRDQSGRRGGTELAVLDAQRATYATNAQTRKSDLDALELRAPHEGVFVLNANWTGEKPAIGANLFAGFDFGGLPDTSAIEVEVALPQQEAQGIRVGDAVELYPVGRPEQKIASKLSWVASAPKVMGRGNPVKFLTMKAAIPVDAVHRYGLVPGQRMHTRIVLLRAERALSVANIAVQSDDGRDYVQVRKGDAFERRAVKLGARGNARSQVLAGLKAGEQVLLTPSTEASPGAVAPAGDATDASVARHGADAAATEDGDA